MFKIAQPTFLFFLLLLFSGTYAQNYNVDSLKIVLANPKIHDTVRINALTGLMDMTNESDQETMVNYRSQLLAIANKGMQLKNVDEKVKNKYLYAAGIYYHGLARLEANKGNPKAALYFKKAQKYWAEGKEYRAKYLSMVSEGNYYTNAKDFTNGFKCYFTALRFYELVKSKMGVANVNQSLGYAYMMQHDYRRSIVHFNKALDYYNVPLSDMWNSDINQKAILLNNVGSAYVELGEYAKAKTQFEESLKFAGYNKDLRLQSMIMSKLVDSCYLLGEIDQSRQYLTQSLALCSDDFSKMFVFTAAANFYHREKNYAKAIEYGETAYALGKKLGHLQVQTKTTNLLYKVYKEKKQFEKAMSMYEHAMVLKDSNNVDASKNELAQQQMKYDFEKKELNQKIAQEKKLSALQLESEQETTKRNYLIIGLCVLLLLIILGGYFYYRNSKQKQAIAVLEKDQIKQKLLVSQMNPHFIFNSIENIQGLIYADKDEEAVKYLSKFSILTRQILENSNENYISLGEEVAMIKNYLAIQQLLYNNKFDYRVSVEEAIDTDAIFLPPMLTQPFIENAIKHGLGNKTENGLVDIAFYLEASKLFFKVTDNGKGFDATAKTGNHKSLAMTITKERLVTYTKNRDFVVQTDNVTDGNNNTVGAKVVFEIPYIYEN